MLPAPPVGRPAPALGPIPTLDGSGPTAAPRRFLREAQVALGRAHRGALRLITTKTSGLWVLRHESGLPIGIREPGTILPWSHFQNRLWMSIPSASRIGPLTSILECMRWKGARLETQ